MNTRRTIFFTAALLSIVAGMAPANAFYVEAGGLMTADNAPEAKAKNIAACFVAVRTAEVGRIAQNAREVC